MMRALVLMFVVAAAGVRADDGAVERLQAGNARLEARVRELETEHASLRARVGAVEAAAERTVTASVDDAGAVTALDVEPSRLELTGGNRSRHWIALHAKQGAGAEIEIEAAASNGAYRG